MNVNSLCQLTSLLLLLVVGLPSYASSLWESIATPSKGGPVAIGAYNNGCLSGAVALPLNGQGYQVLRSQKLRYFGHPSTIKFIEYLGREVEGYFQSRLLVADISLPRGGRFSTGHSSHQTGLDVDIWLRLPKKELLPQELNQPSPISVVDLKQYRLVKKNWDKRYFDLVKMAAQQLEVARIFVHPVIKEQLCLTESSSDRLWLRKVRPWWGHHYHMHIRLRCPEGSTECRAQKLPPVGDGCGAELLSWRPQTKAFQKESPSTKAKRKIKVPPKQCQQLLVEG
ncbi:penicillin-insensitive murein endopeptidase [Vibrio caribbeanicus]|uniref:Penicillin-insensitive murein endopeptidase n=1 Tax=Vibrio caribbeanicus ATCC BAA-2122 TaxID=796620 RepID=E3BMU4_9VIBR|nr:penicillin-insensitive murein endopeptidase [Vibrio caribbeanicus]EFP95570.1 penicillin-insensitive murein endopeptidase [Vibrio caribbeanicus ATCC BAA-2122]